MNTYENTTIRGQFDHYSVFQFSYHNGKLGKQIIVIKKLQGIPIRKIKPVSFMVLIPTNLIKCRLITLNRGLKAAKPYLIIVKCYVSGIMNTRVTNRKKPCFMQKAKLRMWGNGYAIRLPKALIETIGLKTLISIA